MYLSTFFQCVFHFIDLGLKELLRVLQVHIKMIPIRMKTGLNNVICSIIDHNEKNGSVYVHFTRMLCSKKD